MTTSTDILFDRLPPHSHAAEMALLGCFLLSDKSMRVATELGVTRESFADEAHAFLFGVFASIYESTGAIDHVRVINAIKGNELVKAIGGDDYLVALMDCTPSAVTVDYYAKTVADLATIRRVIVECGATLHRAYHANEHDAESVVSDYTERASGVSMKVAGNTSVKLSVLVSETFDRLSAADGEPRGIPTGFYDLDQMLGGVQRSELVIVAARPSMGKTAMALNLAEQAARAKHHVGIFSLEMSRQSLSERLLSSRSGQPMTAFRSGRKMDADRLDNVWKACNELGKLPITIEDNASLTVGRLCSLARRMVLDDGVELLVIDYLQLLTTGANRESRQVEVADMSRRLKALARELDVPVVCLSQLNRASEQRTGNRPRLSDLRESGAIEQDADVVILLHREEYYHIGDKDWAGDNPDADGKAEFIVAKNRNGPTGSIDMRWDAAAMRFTNER